MAYSAPAEMESRGLGPEILCDDFGRRPGGGQDLFGGGFPFQPPFPVPDPGPEIEGVMPPRRPDEVPELLWPEFVLLREDFGLTLESQVLPIADEPFPEAAEHLGRDGLLEDQPELVPAAAVRILQECGEAPRDGTVMEDDGRPFVGLPRPLLIVPVNVDDCQATGALGADDEEADDGLAREVFFQDGLRWLGLLREGDLLGGRSSAGRDVFPISILANDEAKGPLSQGGDENRPRASHGS